MKTGLDSGKEAVVDWYIRPSELTKVPAGKLTTTLAVEKSNYW